MQVKDVQATDHNSKRGHMINLFNVYTGIEG